MVNKNLIVCLDDFGRVHVRVRQKQKVRLKVIISKGEKSYNYNLDNKGKEEIFPLQMGNGTYIITLYKNITNNKYAADGRITIKLKLENIHLPFLYPNQYINYIPKNQQSFNTINEIKKYMLFTFQYDYIRALKIKPNIIPDIDTTLTTHMGICQDLSAVFVMFCRVSNIPARLVIGNTNKGALHAWAEYWDNNVWNLYDITAILQGIQPKYTAERYY